MMGGMSGFEMAQKLKNDPSTAHIPIIFLTALDSENDTVSGFNLGADDYISKPFSIRELIVRVRAVLRRTDPTTPSASEETLSYEGLVIYPERKEVAVDGQTVAFTKTEFELLATLLRAPGHVFSRQELINRVWPKDVLVLDRTVDANITRLRKKIGPYASCLQTRLATATPSLLNSPCHAKVIHRPPPLYQRDGPVPYLCRLLHGVSAKPREAIQDRYAQPEVANLQPTHARSIGAARQQKRTDTQQLCQDARGA